LPETSTRRISVLPSVDAQLDRHAEEVEILLHCPDRAEAFVVAEAEDGVFVGEGWGAGAVEPLREEGGELEVGLRLRDGLDI
jgi:hypothetical protein